MFSLSREQTKYAVLEAVVRGEPVVFRRVNRPDNRGGYLVKVKYPSMSYYPGFVGSFLQPELEEYTR